MRAPNGQLWSAQLCGAFSTLSRKEHDIEKKKAIEHKMCVLIFYTMFFPEIFLILGRIERDMVINVRWSSCKSTRYSCQMLIKL